MTKEQKKRLLVFAILAALLILGGLVFSRSAQSQTRFKTWRWTCVAEVVEKNKLCSNYAINIKKRLAATRAASKCAETCGAACRTTMCVRKR